MKLKKAFSTCVLICSLVLGTSIQADAQAAPTTYTINLTPSGPSPSSLDVKTGDAIGFTGAKDGEFYEVTVTSAPAASGISVGTPNEMLAGCLDYGFNATVAGIYSYKAVYDAGTYTGSITVSSPSPTSYTVHLTPSGPSPSSLDVKTGDVITFVSDVDLYTYGLIWTSVPTGASTGAPVGTATYVQTSLAYTVSAAGTYSYEERSDGGCDSTGEGLDVGSITASAPTTASVQNNVHGSGLSMTVNPDPSNGTATIGFTTDKPFDLQLSLFDASGKQVHEYENIKLGSSEYSLPLSSEILPSGEYYLRAIAGGAIVATTKVLIVH